MMKIFVYGRLMKNGHYHKSYLEGKTCLGTGHIEGYRQYFLGGLHGILPETGSRVQGEVYEIEAATLARLDFLHNQTVFSRGMVDVALDSGDTLPAEVYIWMGSVGNPNADCS